MNSQYIHIHSIHQSIRIRLRFFEPRFTLLKYKILHPQISLKNRRIKKQTSRGKNKEI